MSLENLPSPIETTRDEEWFKRASLGALALDIQTSESSAYNIPQQRLSWRNGGYTVDLGPWSFGQHLPNYRDKKSIDRTNLATDSEGRPIHPWLEDMISDSNLGVTTGKGNYYHWGPNYTADSIVTHGSYLLTIVRKDGSLALPGGYTDKGESAEVTARRETAEETSVVIPDKIKPDLIYSGPVADIRMTANAWPVDTAFWFDLYPNAIRPEAHAGDDADKAFWLPIEAVSQAPMFGSHTILLELARRSMR